MITIYGEYRMKKLFVLFSLMLLLASNNSNSWAKEYLDEVKAAFELEAQKIMKEHNIAHQYAYEYARSKWEMVHAKTEPLETFWFKSAYMQIACGYVPPAYNAIPIKRVKTIIAEKANIPNELILKMNKLGGALNACIGAGNAFAAAHTAIYQQKHDEECAGDKMAQNFKKCEKISYDMLDAIERQTNLVSQMNKGLLLLAVILNSLKSSGNANK